MLKLGAKVNVYDPVANDLAKDVLKGVKFFNSAPLSLINSDGLVLATKWQEFGDLNLRKVKKSMKNPVIFDSRNFFDPSKVKKLGFKYQGIGRS